MRSLKKYFMLVTLIFTLVPITSHAQKAYVYSIAVNGRVTGTTGPSFSKKGNMILFNSITKVGTSNGINHIDMYLSTGNVFSYPPSPGALNLITNSKLAPLVGFSSTGAFAKSTYDLVYTGWSKRCLTVQPDSSVAAALYKSSPNRFISSPSLSAQIYYAQIGPIKLCTTDGFRTLTGTVALKGTSFYASATPTVTYKATISAKFLGTHTF